MSVAIILLAVALLFVACSAGSPGTRLKKCYSFDCKKNHRGKCVMREIEVYDNGVKGMCLWHTDNMYDRVLDPIKKGIAIGEKQGKAKTIDSLLKEVENSKDAKAIHSQEEFRLWLLRHGVK
jgi:hypothetical protein